MIPDRAQPTPIGNAAQFKVARKAVVPAVLGFALFQLGVAGGSASDSPQAERSWLLEPVPREAMRPLSTDRPDQTESAYSVDAGHVQFEVEAAKATFGTVAPDGDRSGRELVVGGVNAKVGLTPRSDLQWVYDGQVYSWSRSEITGRMEQRSGAGDLQTRLKFNLWGNDGGPT
ncbi:MAG: hypothetical protein RLZZ34_1291, partial [Verrucomicrobiota bacterium]